MSASAPDAAADTASTPPSDAPPDERRRRALRLLSFARLDELEAAWAALDAPPSVTDLRGPEVGLVMARGRVGGDGGVFNLGEVAVARATVRLDNGAVGFGHVLGTDRRHAWLAAAFDALAQGAARAGEEHAASAALLAGVEARTAHERRVAAEEAAATRVDFFTLVRGDDGGS